MWKIARYGQIYQGKNMFWNGLSYECSLKIVALHRVPHVRYGMSLFSSSVVYIPPLSLLYSVGQDCRMPSFQNLTPGRCGSMCNFKSIIFKLILLGNNLGICCEIAHKWMPQNFSVRSHNVQVRAWCHQAASHNLSQYRPWSLSPYAVTSLQYVLS